jgi:hypothetical protein
MNNCPERAIETAFGYTAIIWWLILSVFPVLLFNYVINNSLLNISNNSSLATLIYYFVYLAGILIIVFLAYRLLHFLIRFKIFNKIITYTSLSKYSFWRRYKAPKNI